MNSSYQILVRFIFVYQKSSKQTFQTDFLVKTIFWIIVVKKQVWNVCIKAFWYTNFTKNIMSIIFSWLFYTIKIKESILWLPKRIISAFIIPSVPLAIYFSRIFMCKSEIKSFDYVSTLLKLRTFRNNISNI